MLLCAARSVLSQKLPKGYRLQYVIVDDGSSDRTHDVMQKLVNDHDSIVPLYRNREQGGPLTASNALNHGIAYLIDQDAVDYICYLHSDDILTPDSLLERANVLSSDPSIDWCYGNTDRWFADSGQVKRNIYTGVRSSRALLEGIVADRHFYFPHHSAMWRQSMLARMYETRRGKLFNPEYSNGEDRDVTTLSLADSAKRSRDVGFTSVSCYLYRVHRDSITGTGMYDTAYKHIRQEFESAVSEYSYRGVLRDQVFRKEVTCDIESLEYRSHLESAL